MANIEKAIVRVSWIRVGESDKGDYTTGCVITKGNKVVILTCAHQLMSMFEDKTVDELTNDYVISRTTVKVKFSTTNDEKIGRLYATDIVNDLSLVVVLVDESLEQVSTVQINENSVSKSDRLWAIHNRGLMKEDEEGNSSVRAILQSSFTSGFVSHGARFDKHLSTTTTYVEYWMALLGPVSSGSPILNDQNQIVAVHSFELQNMQFGIHVSHIKEFLKEAFNIEEETSIDDIVLAGLIKLEQQQD